MQIILEHFKNNPAVKALINKEGSLASLSAIEEALVFASYYQETKKPLFIVKNNLYEAERLYERISSLIDKEEVLLYATESSLRIEAIAASPEMLAEKVETMSQLLGGNKLCITHTAGIMRYLPSPDVFKEYQLEYQVNQEIEISKLKTQLIMAGYEEELRVTHPLTFSYRGGIVDVYSINYDNPIRIEFFDNEIESIRFFDIESQRTTTEVNEIKIIPATDIIFTDQDVNEIKEKVLIKLEKQNQQPQFEVLEEQIYHDLDYLENHIKDNSLYRYYGYLDKSYSIFDYQPTAEIFYSPIEAVEEAYKLTLTESIEYIQELAQDSKALLSFELHHDVKDLLVSNKQRSTEIKRFASLEGHVSSQILPIYLPKQALVNNMRLIEKDNKDKYVLLCLSETEIKQVISTLIPLNISYQMVNENSKLTQGISLLNYPLTEGFEYKDLKVYTSYELFNTIVKNTRYTNRFKEAKILDNYTDLAKGDYVVHNLYGIGKYLGLKTKEIQGIRKDFLEISYRSDDILLVPLEQFNLVRKFVSSEGVRPKLNKLGTNEWVKTKARIKENVDDLAERLLKLYSEREKAIGFAYSADNDLQREFEAEFEFELTDDQKRATEEIKADMMSSKPMDRLLCGDVGFGKTEVAARAAFKAVNDQKQVAYLCPTTILSRQHYETFLNRFINYPVRIAIINRFVSDKQVKQILTELKEGKIDILIGTHRLLSKQVVFKDLGLLIIDEEQRFGVEHKEKIKEFKQSIDVLSLSATPIPRTLQMSLVGIRKLSQLETPPQNRMPVQTYVIEKNQGVIKEVIQRELIRNGQVFYLYNNVTEIYNVAAYLQKELPEIKLAIVHGQMQRDEIEDVMVGFTNNEYNVLLCTTIIETGIDIPNANTIIIDQADRFGLSQLYQIKGRVGRSDRLAYAYLMYNPTKQLSEIAQKRLQAIKEFTELGSGYRVAMRDLTIRGAGDLLGDNQSGFIDTVGIDMYIELLNQAIAEKRGEAVEEEIPDAKLQLNIEAYVPENFTTYDVDKITLYQKIDSIKNYRQLQDYYQEVQDLYGKVPQAVQLLFEKKRLELATSDPTIHSFKEKQNTVEIIFTQEWSKNVDGVQLFSNISELSKDIKIQYLKGSIIVRIPKKNRWLEETLLLLDITRKM